MRSMCSNMVRAASWQMLPNDVGCALDSIAPSNGACTASLRTPALQTSTALFKISTVDWGGEPPLQTAGALELNNPMARCQLEQPRCRTQLDTTMRSRWARCVVS